MYLSTIIYVGVDPQQLGANQRDLIKQLNIRIAEAENQEQLIDQIKKLAISWTQPHVLQIEQKQSIYSPLRKKLKRNNIHFLYTQLTCNVGDTLVQVDTTRLNLIDWLENAQEHKKYPILIITEDTTSERKDALTRGIGSLQRHFDVLSSFAFTFPFVTYLVGNQYNRWPEIDIVEKVYPLSRIDDSKPMIDRSIEFPEEYYSAGLGILSFFGTYLKEQYPEENAKVKIEQDGLIIRLIVSNKEGKSEIIERALQEFQLIVTGQKTPETFITSDKLILELKNELRIAAVRLEAKRDIINMQQASISKLNKIIEISLSRSQPINIQVNPVITSSTVVNIAFTISHVLENITHLLSKLPPKTEASDELQKVQTAFESIKNENNPDIVKHSNAMSRLKDFITKFREQNDNVDKVLAIGKRSWETFKQLADTYNKIAQWCGLPQVPEVFVK